MYIAFEGVKGVGKSTLLQGLQHWLNQNKLSFVALSPTKPMPEHMALEQSAQHSSHTADDCFLQHLYAARSNYHAEQCNLQHPLILGDRSILTSLSTRWPQQASHIEAYCHQVRTLEYKIPFPDHIIMLDCPDHILQARFAKRLRHYGHQDETLQRISQVRSAYVDLQQITGSILPMMQWHLVDSSTYDLDSLVDCMGQKIKNLIE